MIDRLLGDWRKSGMLVADCLAESINELIVSGILPEGAVMPPQRALAHELGISRATVSQCYDQLCDDDLLVSRQGSGSRIRRRGARSPKSAAIEGRLSTFTDERGDEVDLSSGALGGLSMVSAEIASLEPNEIGQIVSQDGYYPTGLPVLKEALAQYLSEASLPTSVDQILITSGAQQATWLIAHTLIGSGDLIVVEDPSYRGALEAFRACGAHLLAVPLTSEGIDTEHLEHLVRRERPQMVYWQPTVHNPTGQSASRVTKEAVAKLQEHYSLTVVEDGSSNDLIHEEGRTPPTPFARYSTGGETLTVGTASKLFWGGLRVGWIRAHPSTIRRLSEAKRSLDLGGAPIDQLVVARLLPHAHVARKLRARQLGENLRIVGDLFARDFKNWSYPTPAGGTNLWVDVRADAGTLATRAKQEGVLVVPGSSFSANNSFEKHLKIPIAQQAPVLLEGLKRLHASLPESGT
jgi:DNA-binding transcriptional MocR family regulator